MRLFVCFDCNLSSTWIKVQSEHVPDDGLDKDPMGSPSPSNTSRLAELLDDRFPLDSWHNVTQTAKKEALVTVHRGEAKHAHTIRDVLQSRGMDTEVVQNDESVLKVRVKEDTHQP